MKMKTFRDYIRSLKDTNEVFYSTGPEPAALVMSALFDFATKKIKIYCGGFSGEISNNPEYQASLDAFLFRGGHLQIIVQNYDSSQEPSIFTILRKHAQLGIGTVEIKVQQGKIVDKSSNNEIHFATADESMYRIENDIRLFTATGNFMDTQTTGLLNKVFDEVFAMMDSSPIELTKTELVGPLRASI